MQRCTLWNNFLRMSSHDHSTIVTSSVVTNSLNVDLDPHVFTSFSVVCRFDLTALELNRRLVIGSRCRFALLQFSLVT